MTKTKKNNASNYLGVACRAMPCTKRHRPAVWEAMLGTVYAMDEKREIRYFDYDWDAAMKFAGVAPERDPRVHRVRREDNYSWGRSGATHADPRVGKLVLWILKEE